MILELWAFMRHQAIYAAFIIYFRFSVEKVLRALLPVTLSDDPPDEYTTLVGASCPGIPVCAERSGTVVSLKEGVQPLSASPSVCTMCAGYLAGPPCTTCDMCNFRKIYREALAKVKAYKRELMTTSRPNYSRLNDLIEVVHHYRAGTMFANANAGIRDPWSPGYTEEGNLLRRIGESIWEEIRTCVSDLIHELPQQHEDAQRAKLILQEAIEQDLPWATVTVSLLVYQEIIEVLVDHGFDWSHCVWPSSVIREISGGYYAFLRGDNCAKSDRASLFIPAQRLFSIQPLLTRGNIAFGIRKVEGQYCGHWVGPEAEVSALLRILLRDRVLVVRLGSLDTDIEIVLQYWANPPAIRRAP